MVVNTKIAHYLLNRWGGGGGGGGLIISTCLGHVHKRSLFLVCRCKFYENCYE